MNGVVAEDGRLRDWEVSFRMADLVWPHVGDRPQVKKRREQFIEFSLGPCTESKGQRFGHDLEPLYQWLESRWISLFDTWTSTDSYVFDDGFAALFLVRLIWPNLTILLRGHYNANWSLSTTLSRAEQNGTEYLERAEILASQFLEVIAKHPVIQHAYGPRIPSAHQVAIQQHYGFPTDLLDFTYSYDVALFFAEGGTDHLPVSEEPVECGALYAVPSYALPSSALLVTLNPAVLRPSLQRGVFISQLNKDEQENLERYKLVFRHHDMPVWNGLGSIPFGSPVSMGKYLFPLSDPIEEVAGPIRALLKRSIN